MKGSPMRGAIHGGRAVFWFAVKECRQNCLVYLLPVPFFLAVLAARLERAAALPVGENLTLALMVLAGIIAMVYGLQGFASETERRTLDFLLSRPISPVAMVAVKYLLNVGIYLLWLVLFSLCLKMDPAKLPLAPGMNQLWLVMALVVLTSMSFLTGLLTRGAERLLVTVILAAALARLCYVLWGRGIDLMSARTYWFDIPPHTLALITRVFPVVLLACALLVPLVFTYWLLRGRTPLLRFRPFWRLLALWILLFATIEGARATLGPPVWPLPEAFASGASTDWHPRSGVAICGPPLAYKANAVPDLFVARIGGRARAVYHGTMIRTPRWSPDGRSLAFVDDGWIKVMNHDRVKTLTRGEYPCWSSDGLKMVYALPEEDILHFKAKGLYELTERTGRRRLLWQPKEGLLGLAWDSARQILYLLTQGGELQEIDLRTKKSASIPMPAAVKLSMQNPWGVIDGQGRLLLGVVYYREAHLFVHEPGSEELVELEARVGREIWPLSNMAISPEATGFLWPRFDHAYDYQGIIPPDHHDHPGHEHCGQLERDD